LVETPEPEQCDSTSGWLTSRPAATSTAHGWGPGGRRPHPQAPRGAAPPPHGAAL